MLVARRVFLLPNSSTGRALLSLGRVNGYAASAPTTAPTEKVKIPQTLSTLSPDGILTVTMNRPKTLNGWTEPMMRELVRSGCVEEH